MMIRLTPAVAETGTRSIASATISSMLLKGEFIARGWGVVFSGITVLSQEFHG